MKTIARILAACVVLSSATAVAGVTDLMKKSAEPSPALIASVVQKARELKEVRASRDEQRLSAFRSELAELLKGDTAKMVQAIASLNNPSPLSHVSDITQLPVAGASWGGRLSADFALWIAVGTYIGQHLGMTTFDSSLLALAIPGALATVMRVIPVKDSPVTTKVRDGALRWGGVLLSAVAVGDMVQRVTMGDLGWLHGIVDAPSAIGVGIGLAGAVPTYLVLRYVRKLALAASTAFWGTVQMAYAEANPRLGEAQVTADVLELKKEVILVAQGKCPEALAQTPAE